MKFIFSIIAALVFFFQTSEIESLRYSYAKANQSTANTRAFINVADKQSGSDPVILGYKAAAQIMEAKVTTEKGKRKMFVKAGATSLENVIKSNPNNLELRLIRLSVQENIPKIVGYHKNMNEDKAFILSNYSKQNSSLKSYIKRFASQSKTITDTERSALK